MTTNKPEGITTINPLNGKEIKAYAYMTSDEMNDAIQNCHEAFMNWRHKEVSERSTVIKSIGKALLDNKKVLAALMTDEMGKLLSQSIQEIELCAGICDYTAANAPKEFENIERDLADGEKGIISFSPIGIVYGIQPWNYPVYQVMRYAIASLAAGNGVLLKHASNVTGTGAMLEKIFHEAGLPKHLFTQLIIDHDQSDEVIKHKLVRGVTFTGSSGAGRSIGEKAGAALKKSVLELGSNDAYLVLEDADLEVAVEMCVKGRVYNNGETCIAAKRFIVVDAVYEPFKKAFVEAMSNLKMGDPKSEDSDLGPMARKDLRDKMHEQVEESVTKGAEILCGGKIPDGEGYFYPATVLASVAPGQSAYDDEIFGPVASLIKAKDDEDAMRIANDSRFGLGGGIFSKDKNRAIELASKHFDTGMIFINTFGLAKPAMPFGGVKDSGFGREHGGFGMKEFVNVKSIILG
ncbi:NAD-dependent succinate-semialdehyde dehydrogenase [Algoriphagus sp.]|uniref:NAD-dependent succinate-semialdehyde dehydrogenase n=1 Tax=Algoriphagus sp. TaxID=1872435 RepID=UPI0032909BCA